MLRFILISFAASVMLYMLNSQNTGGLDQLPSSRATAVDKTFQKSKNPIDKIVGDKWLDNNTLRPNNFDSLVHIHPKYLRDSSELYRITKVTSEIYLLQRKEYFYQNRKYSLLVKIDSSKILAVIPFVDMEIKNLILHANKLYILRADYSDRALHWPYIYSIEVSCHDIGMRPVWTLSTPDHSGYYLDGRAMKIVNEELAVDFGIQSAGSSTMCIDSYVLTLSFEGNLNEVRRVNGGGCGPGELIKAKTIRSWFELRLR